MKLTRAHITNYRSIIDSTPFTVESDKTILVGINEAGKTALLRAIQTVNPPDDTPNIDYLADYPRSMLNDIQTGHRNPSKIVVAEVTFTLDPDDRAALPNGLSLADDATITMLRYLDNSQTYRTQGFEPVATFGSIKQDLTRLRAHVAKQEESNAAMTALHAHRGRRRADRGHRGKGTERLPRRSAAASR